MTEELDDAISQLAKAAAKAAVEAARKVSEHQIERFQENIKRIDYLLDVYSKVRPKDESERQYGSSDILRAALVLLHASMEDYLRSVASAYFPVTDPESMKNIPLLDTNDSKLHLGYLVRHHNLSVGELIKQSVSAHLNKRSWSSTSEIANLLTQLKIPSTEFKIYFPDVDQMIERRHMIVHRADRAVASSFGDETVQPLFERDFKRWSDSTVGFIVALHYKITFKD